MKHMLSLATLIFTFGLLAHAQTLKFDNNQHDFGTIKEEGGPVEYIFTYVNSGKEAVALTNVKASCGCTTPSWTKEPVLPGKKGEIKVSYNPKNRPGNFNKSITVTTTEATGNTYALTIKGVVTPRPRGVEDDYPQKLGNLRLKTSSLYFDVPNTETKSDTFFLYNESDKAMTLAFARTPKHLSIKAEPATLQPKQKGTIVATFNAAEKKDWGNVYERITVITNDTQDSVKHLHLNANIVEDFSKMTEKERKNAPVASFDTDKYDWGSVIEGTQVEHNFVLTNKGKSDLIIRKTKASCGCTVVQPAKTTLKPGESTDIKTTFNSNRRTGKQQKNITIITNDPNKSTNVLTILGEVQKKETETK